ncbi:MAG TPA: translocase, partial [Chromatiaceae bacterium]|nr:translocase [Chromatiaceae bacterium]
MIRSLKPKSEFSHNVITLMTGTTLAQAIPIAISPILTRLYTPEDFGVLALYMAVTALVSAIATGRYELAIMLPKNDVDAANIVALTITVTSMISLVTLSVVMIYNTEITLLLGNPEISNWLYIVPLTVFLTGVYQSLNYWSNRKKHYKRLSTSRVLQSGTGAGASLSMGGAGFSSGGLIIGQIVGQSVAT